VFIVYCILFFVCFFFSLSLGDEVAQNAKDKDTAVADRILMDVRGIDFVCRTCAHCGEDVCTRELKFHL